MRVAARVHASGARDFVDAMASALSLLREQTGLAADGDRPVCEAPAAAWRQALAYARLTLRALPSRHAAGSREVAGDALAELWEGLLLPGAAHEDDYVRWVLRRAGVGTADFALSAQGCPVFLLRVGFEVSSQWQHLHRHRGRRFDPVMPFSRRCAQGGRFGMCGALRPRRHLSCCPARCAAHAASRTHWWRGTGRRGRGGAGSFRPLPGTRACGSRQQPCGCRRGGRCQRGWRIGRARRGAAVGRCGMGRAGGGALQVGCMLGLHGCFMSVHGRLSPVL